MKELQMKSCKECGHLFLPTHPNQIYCTRDHYRPCPVCGTSVFAKYLSDPARCCSGRCRYISGQKNREAYIAASQHVVDNSKVREYVGETMYNTYTHEPVFVKGHRYEVEINSEGKGRHIIQTSWDVTDNTEHIQQYIVSNKKHISKNFRVVR